MAVAAWLRTCARASAVLSAEKSASSTRERASLRLVELVVRLLTVDSRRFWIAPRSPRLAATVSIALSRSEEHTSELQSLMRISYAVFCLKNKKTQKNIQTHTLSFNTD